MKGKVLPGITATALAVVMCIGFSACGGNAESIRGEEVTEEQWKVALSRENFDNLKLDAKATEMEDGVDKGVTSEVMITYADKKEYLVIDDSGIYNDWSNPKTVTYSKNSQGEWERHEDRAGMVLTRLGAELLFTSVEEWKDEYSEFSFDAEKAGYVQMMLDGELVLKFKGGKLAAILFEDEDDENGTDIEAIFTYGGQSVTLPVVEK